MYYPEHNKNLKKIKANELLSHTSYKCKYALDTSDSFILCKIFSIKTNKNLEVICFSTSFKVVYLKILTIDSSTYNITFIFIVIFLHFR